MEFSTKILFLILLAISIEGQDEICEKNNICNIVHNRFWLPNKHEKLCKCPGKPCPVVYSKEGTFLPINTRSQMRFCEPFDPHLDPCNTTSISLSITQRILGNLPMKPVVQLHCMCEGTKYWKYFSHVERYNEEKQEKTIVDNFRCINLRRCTPNQFCGFARTDYGFLYHRCSCPNHYKCIFDPGTYKIFDGIQELFYNGTAYKAYCRLDNEDDLW